MHLKSLEILGFKSFPDKAVIQFGRGVTAIVGPNGSGKSNIVDAIRWVLGEQSTKTLRGGKMEDVIFGGTLKRGKQGFCEVTLVMDNSDGGIPLDFAEVSVTRRYYRSGESEFYINRKSVRLKDIHELFMDTGLGRDGYSIIGQGRIDEILSVKSADRREIFEEAAGITRFRYRKEESERKLSGCEDNLNRIRDIITELEGQVEPLRQQAEKAKSFLLLRDELRVLEVSIWMDTLEKLKENLLKATTDYQNAERMLSARKRELEELFEKSRQITEEMHAKDLQAEGLRDELRQAENRESEAQGQIAVCRTQIQSNEEHIQSRVQELSAEAGRGEGLTAQRLAKAEQLEQLARQEQALNQRLDGLMEQAQQSARESRDLATRLDGLHAVIQAKRQESADLQAAISAQESGVQEMTARGQSVAAELEALEARLETEGERAKALARQIEENEEKKQSAQNMLRGFALRVESRTKKRDELSQLHSKITREQEAGADRLGLLKAMEREYEGFSQSVRRVMQAAERQELRGVHGPVSALITVEEQYAVAIEIALGGNMQNIVVDSEENGKAAIQYLKSRDLGRATFLPLTAVKERSFGRKISEGEPGFLGWADRLAAFDSRYDRLMTSLLGSTAVTDNMDTAIALAKKHGYAFRIVTLDGQLINPSGAMTGGSLNKKTGVLSRSNEIRRLESELKRLAQRLEEGDRQLREAQRDLDAAVYESGVAEDELRQAQDALLGLEAHREQHGALIATLEASVAALTAERDSRDRRVTEAQAQIAALRTRQQAAKAEEASLLEQAEGLGGGRRRAEDEAGRLGEEGSALRAQLAACRAEWQSGKAGIAELDLLIAAMGQERETKQQAIESIRRRNEELRQQAAGHEEVRDQYAHQAGVLRQRVAALSEGRMSLEGARARCERETKVKNDELLNLERERGRLENKKTQAEMEEDNIIQKLWEGYELTRVTAEGVRRPVESLAQTNRRVAELRAGIKKLGDINLASIEEFARVYERYSFLTEQRDDLEKAKADLLQVIADLTRSMEDIFFHEFKRINLSFQETFEEIFGGGSGYLQLEDEGDILNCGIEIKVELPGKSMRAISLLSGGEKAFVAIALYFAIIKVRPTPFCVLDEIDAALDNVNVVRFSDYMRTLCGSTQFIVITHRQGTMEGCDVLYGVTMQEKGVTKLLTINVTEVEKQLRVAVN